MCQFMIENQGMQSFLVYLLNEEEEVDQACYDLIHDKQIAGILPTFLSAKDKKTCLKFNTSSRIHLQQFFDGNAGKREFLQVFLNIVETISRCKEYTLPVHYICLDSKYIYVNKETKDVELLYCPVIQPEVEMDLRNQLRQVMLQLRYSSLENSFYVSNITRFLEQKEEFSLAALKELLQTMLNKTALPVSSLFKGGKVKMKAIDIKQSSQPEPAQENWAGPKCRETQAEQEKKENGSDKENERDREAGTMDCFKTGFLQHKRTGNVIRLDKQVFKIGKETGFVDYCITDNPAISRSHANIVIENNEYYIMDMNSKNHTVVNGRMLMGTEMVKLIHGSSIQLADEDFEFCLEF
ncbi:DUF6382 domain-containing protein [[Clostridium] polysaccharolyticum]|uniref:FHA domain-containing protein n=1 Tax=[Clostridium] polysaccharolyticum TaxID=29364 RepID=A0A1I0DME5_9FIRM|nr:DUF6382 domain-containing protein [[Clostridium] polysaccharolyticum]SET33656.1 FHA domain-containing protein [[Clostridium] polysaccharolyticum]